MCDFDKLEHVNCRIDVWIDEEEYGQVIETLETDPAWGKLLKKAFRKETCTFAKDKEWLDLITADIPLPITKVHIDKNEIIDMDAENRDWSIFFSAKLIRAKIQQKVTDCYFRRLDEIVAYLERHLPKICQDNNTTKLAVIYLLEMAAAGVEADHRSFSERARRILQSYINKEDDDFTTFYDLLARYNIGVGYFHERNYEKALLEFDLIIFKINHVTPVKSFFTKRLLNELIYQPSVLYKADVHLKMQLAYHAINTLTLYLKKPSKYKLFRANLLRAEACQQLDQYPMSYKFIRKVAAGIHASVGNKDDVAIIPVDRTKQYANIRSRLQNLLLAYYMNSINNKIVERTYCEDIVKFLVQFRKTTYYQKTNRHGFLEQTAELIGMLVNAEQTESAASVYSVARTDILKPEDKMSFPPCPCKEEGIDLRRLSAEHYHGFSKNIRDYYEHVNRKKDKANFLERLENIEEGSLNLEWRKWEIALEKSAKSFTDWGTKCLANSKCVPRGFVKGKQNSNGFKNLLPCAGLSTAFEREYLTSNDYETLMNNWDEHFEKHLKYRTFHDPSSSAIHFLGLQRWNSTSPAQGKSLGGGYLIYHTSKMGRIDLGIALDPGFDFIRNLFHVGFSLADIDIVILSHAHVDHVRDFESMLGLLFELKSRDKQKQQKLHTIMTLGVYHRVQYLVDSPGLREFVEPYIVDIEKGVNSVNVYRTKFEFTQLKGKTPHGDQFTPLIKGLQSRAIGKIKVIIEPTQAYHNDHSEYSDTYGFKLCIDGNDESPKYTIGYTSDTRWHNEVIESYRDCDAILIHLGSLINRKKGPEREFKHYRKSKYCFEMIRKKNHPYLMGMLYFLKQIKEFEKKPLILLSEFGEELRGRIRLDLVNRLKIEYGNGTLREDNILPVDVGLDVLLYAEDNKYKCPCVWCIQCQQYVSLSQVNFETYGYDEALFCVCKTCAKSTPQNVMHESLRSLYEEGRSLRT